MSEPEQARVFTADSVDWDHCWAAVGNPAGPHHRI